ncbi:hypothetical protein [Granulicella sibirica]|uniref:Uncharacterized protein n=1 Tax=Granulicella sibirica TaxID=2479048 RepID=A0A4Q0SWJ9_9BACT|nr:hypothetical protein [Granulicella sibirica]RXH54310.1 hypothetical protein GRAN_4606 [Granulicella sibirica]
MSNLINETPQEETKKPAAGADADELKDEELENVSGGRPISLNPQPLPPYDGGF